jgi:hypothetical protein
MGAGGKCWLPQKGVGSAAGSLSWGHGQPLDRSSGAVLEGRLYAPVFPKFLSTISRILNSDRAISRTRFYAKKLPTSLKI